MPPEPEDTISVGSASISLGDRLPEFARESIRKVASKFFGRLNSASVHFTREGITYRCSVNMQMGGLPVKSAEAIYVAFDLALNKVAKQLRRTTRELREDKPEGIDKEAVLRNGLQGGADQP